MYINKGHLSSILSYIILVDESGRLIDMQLLYYQTSLDIKVRFPSLRQEYFISALVQTTAKGCKRCDLLGLCLNSWVSTVTTRLDEQGRHNKTKLTSEDFDLSMISFHYPDVISEITN